MSFVPSSIFIELYKEFMHRFGTQYLYCPNELCSGNTHEYRRPLLVEEVFKHGTETTEKTQYTLKCPLCTCHLFQCDNCFALIKGITPPQKLKHTTKGTDKSRDESVNGSDSFGESEYVICLECGFINVLHSSIRKKLQLKPLSPLKASAVRFIQKCICGDDSNQTQSVIAVSPQNTTPNLETPKPSNSNTPSTSIITSDNPSELLMKDKKRQITPVQSPSSAKKPKLDAPAPSNGIERATPSTPISSARKSKSEAKILESISFWNTCHKFSNSHLLMLQALYHREPMDPLYEAASFVKDHMDMIHVKLQCEAALKVWERLKFSTNYIPKSTNITTVNNSDLNSSTTSANNNNNNTTNNTKNLKHTSTKNNSDTDRTVTDQQASAIVSSILWSRYDRLRRKLHFCTKPYMQFLVEINTELTHLYSHLQSIIEWLAENSSSGWDTSRQRFDKEESVLELINKITLWRQLYKTISVCVL